MMKKYPASIASSRPEEVILVPQASVAHHHTLVPPKPLLPSDMAQATFLVESWLVKEDKELRALRPLHHSQINKAPHIKCRRLDLTFKAHLLLKHLRSKVVAMAKVQRQMATLLNLLRPPPLLALAKALA
jgi:hypothetical protein